MEDHRWACYLLQTKTLPMQTYVGATVDLDRRLRQHNGELVGGAKRTTAIKSGWERACHTEGFLTQVEALQFEWAWKYHSRKCAKSHPMERRVWAVNHLLSLPKWEHISLVWEKEDIPSAK